MVLARLRIMPRYFFHIREHDTFELDREGVELPDIRAARREAVAAAKEMVVEAVRGDEIIDHRQIEIMASDGKLVAVVPLQSVIKL